MSANIGTIDRALRAILGLALVILALVSQAAIFSGLSGWILLAVGLVLLGTAGMKFCPLYRLIGVRTCSL